MIDIEEVKREIRNAFSEITFIESSHQYIHKGFIMESSSSYRKEFENDFDSVNASKGKARSNAKKFPDTKRDAAYYVKRWDLLGEEARTRGTRVHLFSETYPDFDEPSCVKEKGIVEFFDTLDPKYVVIWQELVMYDTEFYKAGTADLILLNTETGNIVIADWKTNDKSVFENYKNKKLKGIFKEFKDTAYNKYSMQLSHYQYMLEKYTSLKVESKWLIWLSNSPKRKEHKDYSYLKINAIGKGKYFRTYACRNFAKKIGDSFTSRKEAILSNVKQVSIFDNMPGLSSLDMLNNDLPSLPKLPAIKNLPKEKTKRSSYTYNKKKN